MHLPNQARPVGASPLPPIAALPEMSGLDGPQPRAAAWQNSPTPSGITFRKHHEPQPAPDLPSPIGSVKPNPILHRLHNRCWNLIRSLRMDAIGETVSPDSSAPHSSISSSMPWVQAAEIHSNQALPATRFRRLKAVCDVVETVGPVDGRCYARKIRNWEQRLLDAPKVLEIDSWGDPLRWPAALLGTPRAFSPTTLRYLATALWLKRSGFVPPGSRIVEVGVGFGGLAAMNATVSRAHTTFVDLPQVGRLAQCMMDQVGLSEFCGPSGAPQPGDDWCFISNYAFTELAAPIQDAYLEKWIRHAPRGVIVSNAGIFSKSIGGRSDADLVRLLESAGIQAKMDPSSDLFSPADGLCGVTLIHWNHPTN